MMMMIMIMMMRAGYDMCITKGEETKKMDRVATHHNLEIQRE